MNIVKILITIGISLLFFSGCAKYEAKNHLNLKEIDQGLELTKKELRDDPNDMDMNYYHGRFLVSQKKYDEAIKYFKKASESFFSKTYHKLWLGIAYGKAKDYDNERKVYVEILEEKNGRYKSALAYLGKNYHLTKQYQKAIETFERGLELYKKPHSYMYYYYAKSLLAIGEKEKAKEYFTKYLKKFPDYSLAKGSIYNLNKLDDFTYSNFKIANEIVAIQNMDYIGKSNEIEYYSKQGLKKIAKVLHENKDHTLYIVSYDVNDIKRAEIRVKNIKKFILSEFDDIEFSDIRIAWFKSPRNIEVDKKIFKQDIYVNFFTTNKKDK